MTDNDKLAFALTTHNLHCPSQCCEYRFNLNPGGCRQLPIRNAGHAISTYESNRRVCRLCRTKKHNFSCERKVIKLCLFVASNEISRGCGVYTIMFRGSLVLTLFLRWLTAIQRPSPVFDSMSKQKVNKQRLIDCDGHTLKVSSASIFKGQELGRANGGANDSIIVIAHITTV